jgi:hypothetical protein
LLAERLELQICGKESTIQKRLKNSWRVSSGGALSPPRCDRAPDFSMHTGATPLEQLTDQGRQKIDELAQRYAVSTDAVMTLLQALLNSNGTMAQFNHQELGGGG